MYSYETELFEIELIIYIKMNLALNNLQRLICDKTQPTNKIVHSSLFSALYIYIYIYKYIYVCIYMCVCVCVCNSMYIILSLYLSLYIYIYIVTWSPIE